MTWTQRQFQILIKTLQNYLEQPEAKYLGLSLLTSQTLLVMYLSHAQPLYANLASNDPSRTIYNPNPESLEDSPRSPWKDLLAIEHHAHMQQMQLTDYTRTPSSTNLAWVSASKSPHMLKPPLQNCTLTKLEHDGPDQSYHIAWHCLSTPSHP